MVVEPAGVMLTEGAVPTVTVTVEEAEQLASPPFTVTVYVVVVEGLAVGLATFVADKPVAGDHEYT
jgi:hypothetical protein